MVEQVDREAVRTFLRDNCSVGAQMLLGAKPAAILSAFAAHRLAAEKAERERTLAWIVSHQEYGSLVIGMGLELVEEYLRAGEYER